MSPRRPAAIVLMLLAALALPGYSAAQAGGRSTAASDPMPDTAPHAPRYGLIASMRTKPGQRDAVVALLLRDVDALRSAGCHLYLVGADDQDADLIRVTEVWTSKQAHRASLQLPSVRVAIAEAMPLLTGEFTQVEFSAIGGLGLAE